MKDKKSSRKMDKGLKQALCRRGNANELSEWSKLN